MLSQLNPNAEPFYFRPNPLLFLPCPNYYYAHPCTSGLFCPPIHAADDATSDTTHEVVKPVRVPKRVWAKGNWRCHHTFSSSKAKTEWRVKGAKGRKLLEKGTSGDRAFRRNIIPFPETVEEAHTSSTTTVMIRNVPNQFKLEELLLILDEYCLQQNKNANDPADWCKFDFVYLPMDYRKHAIEKRMSNLGYAFVNFTTPSAAFKFYEKFQGLEWNVTENRKTCEINVAQYQGKDTLMRVFQRKVFRCESREFLPVAFSEGRDGLNRRIERTYVGNHVWGLPRRRSIGTCASYQNQ
ncbi:protein terminal ear1-like [Abrus precatorius]|uniref:Protein terminal ear1-like n=1 Tax=Abrus precatorius TaxID=3816 RepID=A0A8B8MKD5_ABRPR|nr:protein terminal ear1-like [Abrus precatorius]